MARSFSSQGGDLDSAFVAVIVFLDYVNAG